MSSRPAWMPSHFRDLCIRVARGASHHTLTALRNTLAKYWSFGRLLGTPQAIPPGLEPSAKGWRTEVAGGGLPRVPCECAPSYGPDVQRSSVVLPAGKRDHHLRIVEGGGSGPVRQETRETAFGLLGCLTDYLLYDVLWKEKWTEWRPGNGNYCLQSISQSSQS